MPKIKITIILTPDEFRKTLPPKLKEVYDRLLNILLEYGIDEKEAKTIVAIEMAQAMQDLLKEKTVK